MITRALLLLAIIFTFAPAAWAQPIPKAAGKPTAADCSAPPPRSNWYECERQYKDQSSACRVLDERCREEAEWFYDDVVCHLANNACMNFAAFNKAKCMETAVAAYATACRQASSTSAPSEGAGKGSAQGPGW
jgi:hypothetical protein